MVNKLNRENDKFIVRLPDGMRERIKSSAAKNGRSMNSEVVSVLEERYPEPNLERLAEQVIAEISKMARCGGDDDLAQYMKKFLETLKKKA